MSSSEPWTEWATKDKDGISSVAIEWSSGEQEIRQCPWLHCPFFKSTYGFGSLWDLLKIEQRMQQIPSMIKASSVTIGDPVNHRESPPCRSSSKLERTGKSVRKARRAASFDGRYTGCTLVGQVDRPLSETTAHMINIPLKDMDQWAHRLPNQRLQEEKQKGRVRRPLNAFMLYKCAYHKRTQELFIQKELQAVSQQNISRVVGASWGIEPYHIRQKYKRLARIDRDNHKMTFPAYKFKPKKRFQARKRRELSSSTSTTGNPCVDDVQIQELGGDDYSWTFLQNTELQGTFDSHATICPGLSSSFTSDHSYPHFTDVEELSFSNRFADQPTTPYGCLAHVENDTLLTYDILAPQSFQQNAAHCTTGFQEASHLDIIQPQPDIALPNCFNSSECFKSQQQIERGNITDSTGIDRLQHLNSLAESCSSIPVPSDTLRLATYSNAIISNLGPPWDLSYHEDHFQLQDDLSDPDSAIIRYEENIMFKAPREFQTPQTVTPADTLLHTSTATNEYFPSGYGNYFLNEQRCLD